MISLVSFPLERMYIGNPIPCMFTSDLVVTEYSQFELTISGSGPSSGQTLLLSWPGGSITYTAGTAPVQSGLRWPLKGAETLEIYADNVAEFLRQREEMNALFIIERSSALGEKIFIRARQSGTYILGNTNGMSGVAVVENEAGNSTPANLRAYVEVWSDTGDFNTQELLTALHSPYRPTTDTVIDIAPAFTTLRPYLPNPLTINPSSMAPVLPLEEATGVHQKYIFRYADKYGTPAMAEKLELYNDPAYAFWGAFAGNNFDVSIETLLHAYVDKKYQPLHKPVGETQPDWIYWLCDADVEAGIVVELFWSDGTSSGWSPWGVSTRNFEANKIYVFQCGFVQLNLESAEALTGVPTLKIVGYRMYLGEAPELTATVIWQQHFRVQRESEWGLYILYDNGLGGCESVWMRGKKTESYLPKSEEYTVGKQINLESPRQATDHDINTFDHQARTQWEVETGWYDTPDYLDHLKQLPMARYAWIIDLQNRRFLACTVQAGEMKNVTEDDVTLYSQSFTIRSGWEDTNYNIFSAL